MAAELFNQSVGTNIVIVPYQGGSNQSVVDLLAGRIKLMFGVAVTMAPYVATGRLKALAVAQSKRAAILPDVPTLAEAGMPGYDAGIWIGLLAPKGTPAAILDKLSGAADDALKVAQVETTLKKQGTDPLAARRRNLPNISRQTLQSGPQLSLRPATQMKSRPARLM